MLENHLGYRETAAQFSIRHKQVQSWERIYLEEGPEVLRLKVEGVDRPKKPPQRELFG